MSATKFDRLGDHGELVRPDRHEQEDRLVGVAPDHVPKEPQCVLVGPLDVVDEESERSGLRQHRDRHAREVECPEELRVGRHALEAGLVPPGDGLDHPPDGGLRRGAGGRVADRVRREQAAGEEEWSADLLVGGDRHAGEPPRRGHLDRGEQQARLADARLTLEGDRRKACRRFVELLRDRRELGASTDDPARHAPQLDRERALGPDDGVEHPAVGRPDLRRVGHVAARSSSAYLSSERATLARGSIRAGEHSSPQRTAKAAASRSRSSIRTHAASRCGSR